MLVADSLGYTEIPIAITDDVDRATRLVRHIACSFGFSKLDANLIASATSELAMNIVLHASHGVLQMVATDNARGLQIVFVDEGPGIVDIDQARVTGYSSRQNGLGLGLTAAGKAVEYFDIFSVPGKGTTATIRHYRPPESNWFDVGVVSLADENYSTNGDVAYSRVIFGDTQLLAVIDGSGQGEPAREAAVCAQKVLEAFSSSSNPRVMVERAHDAVRKKKFERGFSISLLLANNRHMTVVSVGDVVCRVFDAETGSEPFHFMELPGTLGTDQEVTLREQQVDISHVDTALVVVMASDGISTDFAATGDPIRGEAIDIAHALMHNFRAPSGDSTVAVMRMGC
ncbi:MAG: ATP-binding protein [Granulosicoccus sp.]